MSEWEPRHRRRRPGALALYAVLGAALLVAAGGLWSVSALFTSDDDSSDREGSDTSTGVEQSETPGGQVGDAGGRYRVWVPEIGLRAPVVDIVSDDDRVLAPPEDPLVAGWWSQGVAPGDESGTALIVGHAVESGAGVFNEVGDMGAGDMIILTGEAVLAYEVSSVEALPPEQLAERAESLFAQDGDARLVLVTCEGWDGEDFRSNIVVTAVLP
ncbi:class F sortase [Phytoactinopolyspora endophytica]|uniref:class F sortase n=1 Tax=Phytoactinopolyspora endophytica TaxID=1642495 RepID=UPI0013EDEB37|nr:class F sortase [Phytoactinopolyspora endophytica]